MLAKGLTLAEAIKTKRLQEFIAHEEALGRPRREFQKISRFGEDA